MGSNEPYPMTITDFDSDDPITKEIEKITGALACAHCNKTLTANCWALDYTQHVHPNTKELFGEGPIEVMEFFCSEDCGKLFAKGKLQ